MKCNGSSRISPGEMLHRFAIPSVLGLALCILLPKMVLATGLPDAQLTQSHADAQIASLLTKIDRALAKSDGTPSDDVIEMLFSVLALGPTSSTKGHRLITEFRALLMKRAGDERASGHPEKAVYFSAFAEVIEPVIQQNLKQADIEIERYTIPAGRVSDQENAAGNRQTEALKQVNVPMEATPNTKRANSNKVPVRPPDSIAASSLPAATPASTQTGLSRGTAGLGVTSVTQTTVIASAAPHGVVRAPDLPKTLIIAPPSTALPSIQQTALSRGDLMLSLGDIMAARLLFAHAAASGIGVAALKLGDTYSPAVLGELRLRGIKADFAEAEAWYRKAQALGEAQAEERLKKLGDYWPAMSSTR